MKKINFLSLMATVFLVSGCLTPYNEEFTCNKGVSTGVCASVSENYKNSFKDEDEIPLTKRQIKIFLEGLEKDEVIDTDWFNEDDIEDWDEIKRLSIQKLNIVLAHYDLSEKDQKKIKRIIAVNKYIKNRDNSYFSTSNISEDELLYYQYLENERLKQDLEYKKESLYGK
jgi:hypothetical protein